MTRRCFSHALPALFVFCFAVSGCGTTKLAQDQKIQSYLTAAQEAAVIGETARARRLSDEAVSVAPTRSETYLQTNDAARSAGLLDIAGIFSAAGDNPTLAEYLQTAVKQSPQNYQMRAQLAQTLGTLGKTTEQRTQAAETAKLLETKIHAPGTKNQADLSVSLAQAYWDAGNLAKGEQNFRAAIRAYPDNWQAQNGLAYDFAVANQTANLTEAAKLAQSALKIARRQNEPDENVAMIQDTLGWIQYRQGFYKDAETSLLLAVNALPRQAEVRYHLAMTEKALGKIDAARTEFARAVALSKGYADAQRELVALGGISKPSVAP